MILKQRGTPVTTILYSDLGVNSIGLAIVTTTGLEQNNPDLVKRFIAATQESFERGAKHPEDAAKALLAAVPTLPADLSLADETDRGWDRTTATAPSSGCRFARA